MTSLKKKRFAITGATGLLGSNLLFEIIKRHLNDLDMVEIIILGRGKNNLVIEQRIRELLTEEGLSYLGVGNEFFNDEKELFGGIIKCMNLDLGREDLGLSQEDLYKLKAAPIDIFFHVAALTDFRSTPKVIDSLRKTNVLGTEKVLRLVSSLKIRQFCYVGSAYSCGDRKGNIRPDFINLKQNFRNPYEATKLEAELLVRFFSDETGVPCKIFRTSTICGRLIESDIGLVNKFDVFYAWAAFFLRAKMKNMGSGTDLFGKPAQMNARILYSMQSGLNIVPADYAAKAMYEICSQDNGTSSYHLVNEHETPHSVYVPIMLETLNICGITTVQFMPTDMNRLEELYYKTVGKIYTPYVASESMLFDTTELKRILGSSGISCPEVDSKNFTALMQYAKSKNFGIHKSIRMEDKVLEMEAG